MKKFFPTLLTGLAVMCSLGALTIVSADADARGRSSGARSHSTGARSHSTGVRTHTSGVRSHSFYRSAGVGVFIGAPIIASPWWYNTDPYYGYGPYYSPVQGQQQPTVYVEQQAPMDGAQPTPQAQAQQYWYYCQDSNTYFPYVQSCATPWQPVVPHAPQ